MNTFKKHITRLALLTILCTSAISLSADECCDDGCAYNDCRRAPVISPQCAIGAVAVISTVAVLLHSTSKRHHAHSHSH